MTESHYKVEITAGQFDPDDDNVDVTVRFEDGRRYEATFFTLRNIQSLMTRYVATGECASGLYFCASAMVVIQRLTRENIHAAISNLLSSEEFASCFDGPFED